MIRKITTFAVFVLVLLITTVLFFFRTSLTHSPLPHGSVGFFSPSGIPGTLISKTHFGVINAFSPAQVEDNLKRANGKPFMVSVDLGPVISAPTAPDKLNVYYSTPTGEIRTKQFPAQEQNKLLAIPADFELRKQMAPFLDVMARYPANIGTIFLADEPYLNGITKSEMERAASVTRQELKARGMDNVKLGVIFASGMFNTEFAKMINERSGVYVSEIDNYFLKGNPSDPAGHKSWVEIIKKSRLATYDRAGNLYVDGGLPQGFDVYGFDFYLSTLLLDNLLENTLQWFAVRYPDEYGCGQFADQTMTKIRSRLSFFHNDAIRQGESHRVADRKILDAIYECRMGAVTAMLKASAVNGSEQFLMISESSSNGVFEFNSLGNIKLGQPELLVESRVFDEVIRAQSFYARNISTYSAGLMYFTYQDEYDQSINLHIGGVSSMPSVLAAIYEFAATISVPH